VDRVAEPGRQTDQDLRSAGAKKALTTMPEAAAETPNDNLASVLRGPLSGIRVLDLTRFLAGPHCTRMLCDLGADVIKVEPPTGGDISRTMGMRVDHMSLYFLQHNSGKRNLSIDLTKPEGAELVARLAERCDVLVENFLPGVMARFGLGFPTLSQRNERLIFASISGYGQQNLWRHRKAFAPVIHAEGGLTAIHARRYGEEQPFEATAHADVYAGMAGLSGVLAALYQREVTGRGQYVDVSMAGTMLSVNDRAATELAAEDPGRFDGGGSVVVRIAEGATAVISGDPRNKTVFRDYCRAMARPELEEDPRFNDADKRTKNRPELIKIIQEWVLEFTDFTALEASLSAIHLPIGRIRTVKEIAASEWALESGAFVEVSDRHGGMAKIPQSPWRFSGAASGARGTAAFPGEHNELVMQEVLGLTPDEISELEASGVLRSRLPGNLIAEPIPSVAAGPVES
jgi:CoA:oxalate CoA-transferase